MNMKAGIGNNPSVDHRRMVPGSDMVQTLAMRDAQRMDEQKRQKAIRHEQADPTENANAFWLKFKPEAQALHSKLNDIIKAPSQDSKTALESSTRALDELRLFVATASAYLPAWDLRTSEKEIKELEAEIKAAHDAAVPKKKFSFKSRPNKKQPSTEEPEPGVVLAQPDHVDRVADALRPATAELANDDTAYLEGIDRTTLIHKSTHSTISRNAATLQDTNFTLSQLDECSVLLYYGLLSMIARSVSAS